MLMQCVVKIPELNTIFFVAGLEEIPVVPEGVEIVPEGRVESPPDISAWPQGERRPLPPTLGVSRSDPTLYREFKSPEELELAGFEPTGMNYGGAYSPWAWQQLAERIPALKAFDAITGNDRPGAMDEAMRYIREAH